MIVANQKRDYSMQGPENKLAHEKGLATAEWYVCPIPRQRLKELMKRKDGPAIRDTLIWFGLMIVAGIVAFGALGGRFRHSLFMVLSTHQMRRFSSMNVHMELLSRRHG